MTESRHKCGGQLPKGAHGPAIEWGKRRMNRRDFIKTTVLGVAALTFNPFSNLPTIKPEYPGEKTGFYNYGRYWEIWGNENNYIRCGYLPGKQDEYGIEIRGKICTGTAIS